MDDASSPAPSHSPERARAPWSDPALTADGAPRAQVAFTAFQTLWFNTGTVCNLACATCYIESAPDNDRLSFLTVDDIAPYLTDLDRIDPAQSADVGFTGGEPFANPAMPDLAEAALARGRRVLILTNGFGPVLRPTTLSAVERLHARYGAALRLRVSLDHHTHARHDAERGSGAFARAMEGLERLADLGLAMSVAGRIAFDDDGEVGARAGFAALFARHGLAIDAQDPDQLVLFPDMDLDRPAPEITDACWGVLGVAPETVMCASSRMVIKRKGEAAPTVAACTLLPYEPAADMGPDLQAALAPVTLSHKFCAQFCVLGGASCSSG